MPDNSFDVVSKVEMPEVINAISQAMKEVITRFDLKDSKSDIQLNEKENKITLALDAALPAMIEEITERVLVALGH